MSVMHYLKNKYIYFSNLKDSFFPITNLSFWFQSLTPRLSSNPQIIVFLAASETLLLMLHPQKSSFHLIPPVEILFIFKDRRPIFLKKHFQVPPERLNLSSVHSRVLNTYLYYGSDHLLE